MFTFTFLNRFFWRAKFRQNYSIRKKKLKCTDVFIFIKSFPKKSDRWENFIGSGVEFFQIFFRLNFLFRHFCPYIFARWIFLIFLVFRNFPNYFAILGQISIFPKTKKYICSVVPLHNYGIDNRLEFFYNFCVCKNIQKPPTSDMIVEIYKFDDYLTYPLNRTNALRKWLRNVFPKNNFQILYIFFWEFCIIYYKKKRFLSSRVVSCSKCFYWT